MIMANQNSGNHDDCHAITEKLPEMNNCRAYGHAPFNVVVVHGGPGAQGEMAPVARALETQCGVIEPFQCALNVQGQIEELHVAIRDYARVPVVLIGFSWGAWLSYMVAAQYPRLVRKLIMIGSGPLEERYAANIHETRLQRLSANERAEAIRIADQLKIAADDGDSALFERYGAIMTRASAHDLEPDLMATPITYRADIFRSVWPEAAQMRKSGALLALRDRIICPVTVIHGDYDPHPAEGVRRPLSLCISDFRFLLLQKCGHKPWIERAAREHFFEALENEVNSD